MTLAEKEERRVKSIRAIQLVQVPTLVRTKWGNKMGQYDDEKVAVLKDICLERNIAPYGKKSQIIERLEYFDQVNEKKKRGEKFSWEDRFENFKKMTGYENYLFHSDDGWIAGTWVMGGDYTVNTGYYGGYPAGYLLRIKALFPDKQNILHVFSGQVDLEILNGHTVDLDDKQNPNFVDDAQTLEKVPVGDYDLILADPPYSVEDAEHYEPSMVSRNKVMRALGLKAKKGTHVVWLDQVLPMYRKDQWDIQAVIGMVKSTNHRFRVITIFEKNCDPESQ